MTTHKIIIGDCIKAMEMLPEAKIDLVLTDPPYNISTETVIERKGGKFGVAKDIVMDFGDWDHNVIEPKDWVPLTVSKLTDVGVFISLYDKEKFWDMISVLKNCEMFIRHVGGWHKQNPAPQARKVKWQDALELFVIATKNRGTGHHYNYKLGQHHDVITTPICMGNERLNHPTQKPEALFEPLIKWWSFKGDTILDPFWGVGTTTVVAQRLGRNSIGIEINPEYIEIAKKRLRVNEQLTNDVTYEFIKGGDQ